MEIIQTIAGLLEAVRRNKPIVHHITNYVTVNDCANIALAVGASPIMADELEEMNDIVSIASALVINIGTLNRRTIESMVAAGKRANERGIPVVLDPVGAGASGLRNAAVERLLSEVKIGVLRGNLSEIRFAAGLESLTKGVDASEADLARNEETAQQVAERAATKLGCIVALTGAIDVISDGKRTLHIHNGVPQLSGVTGTGCMCSTLIGAFCGAKQEGDLLLAAAAGVAAMGIAGELAAEAAEGKGSGSFHIAIIDAVSRMDSELLASRAVIEAAAL
ncbi:hydroxyethylthiazole kinase [Paenibacillus algorifonticola]|uniref:Hydroxyethylthiazole kinase n=1 Tax=Paenibacillus algorifonticola TaxID=684063 RepID=A0A1I2HEF6_9BACL|nr:hydroxyethylthiazole kinase [Paenibacillus algorifonticola]SFF27307.1 hydroxyethylthiazole kinase [Paenibacillus algorifonticola]